MSIVKLLNWRENKILFNNVMVINIPCRLTLIKTLVRRAIVSYVISEVKYPSF